ncbi:hypothetical protein Tco_0879630 [Tanacetum coccineum]
MESLNSNSKERELQLTQRLVKQRHSHCMAWFEQLETHLCDLYLNSSSHAIDAFKPAFYSFFVEEHQTFRLKMFHNLDQLRLQHERENLLEVNPRTCLEALRTQFKEFFASKRVNSSEHLNQCWQKEFKEYMFCEPDTYRRDLLENLDTLEAVIHRASENNHALGKSVNETQLQQHEILVTESTELEANLNTDIKALDAGSVITESSGTKSDKHDLSSSPGTYITHAVDADIRPVNDQVPFAEQSLVIVDLKFFGSTFDSTELYKHHKASVASCFLVDTDGEPPNGSNDDITNPYECNQTLNVSACTLNLSAGLALQRHMASADNTSGPAPQRKERYTILPEPEYPEYLVPSEDEAPWWDQPLPADASPAALSPGYVPDSDPEEDPEEDSEEEHADYPADGGDGDDEPSGDDTDDDDEEPFEDEEDDEEEEEHLAPADSSAIPVVDPVPSAGDTEAFETDESAPTPRPPQIRIPFCPDTST